MIGLFALVAVALTCFSMGSKGEWASGQSSASVCSTHHAGRTFSVLDSWFGQGHQPGSSLLVMMIVGGAIMPLIRGALMDKFGKRTSLGIVWWVTQLSGLLWIERLSHWSQRAGQLTITNFLMP